MLSIRWDHKHPAVHRIFGASFYIFIQGCFDSSSVDDPNGVLSSTKELQLCSMCTIAGAAAAFMSTCFLAYEFSYADSEGLNNKE